MGRKSKHSKQFREEACKLVNEHGYSVREAARQLNLPHNTLWNWLSENGQCNLGDQELSSDPRVLKVRIKELQERVRHLEMEKDILKKAAAYFAREQT